MSKIISNFLRKMWSGGIERWVEGPTPYLRMGPPRCGLLMVTAVAVAPHFSRFGAPGNPLRGYGYPKNRSAALCGRTVRPNF